MALSMACAAKPSMASLSSVAAWPAPVQDRALQATTSLHAWCLHTPVAAGVALPHRSSRRPMQSCRLWPVQAPVRHSPGMQRPKAPNSHTCPKLQSDESRQGTSSPWHFSSSCCCVWVAALQHRAQRARKIRVKKQASLHCGRLLSSAKYRLQAQMLNLHVMNPRRHVLQESRSSIKSQSCLLLETGRHCGPSFSRCFVLPR